MRIRFMIAALLIAAGLMLVPVHGTDARAAGPLTVMSLGDSITLGQGDGQPAGSNNGYRCSLKNRLASGGLTIDYVGSQVSGTSNCPDRQHEGHPGKTIDQIAALAPAKLAAHRPDVVLLMAGTNDIRLKTDMPRMADRLSTLIDVVRAAAPQATIVVSTIPQVRTTEKARVDAWNLYRDRVPQVVASKDDRVFTAYNERITQGMLNPSPDWLHPRACAYGSLMAFNWYMAISYAVPNPSGHTWNPLWPPVGC